MRSALRQSTTNDDFALRAAGKKKFQGRSVDKQFFKHSVIEVLALLRSAPRALQQSFAVLDAIVIDRKFRCFLVRVEES